MNKKRKMTLLGLLITGLLLISIGAGWSAREWHDVEFVDVEMHPEMMGLSKLEHTLKLDPDVKGFRLGKDFYGHLDVRESAGVDENEVRVSGYYKGDRFKDLNVKVSEENVLSLTSSAMSSSGPSDWEQMKTFLTMLKNKKIPSSLSELYLKVELSPKRYADYLAAEDLRHGVRMKERDTFRLDNGETVRRVTHDDGSVTYEKVTPNASSEWSEKEDENHE